MDRSNTVRASFAIIVIWLLGVILNNTLQQSASWIIVRLLVLAALLRLFVLFWQTLVHAVQSRSLGWVVGHFFFGSIASVLYYLVTKTPSLPTNAGIPAPVAGQGLPNQAANLKGNSSSER